jgi:hypothetical protein
VSVAVIPHVLDRIGRCRPRPGLADPGRPGPGHSRITGHAPPGTRSGPARRRRPHHPRHPSSAASRHPGEIISTSTGITVTIDRRACSPVLRDAGLPAAATTVPWRGGRQLRFKISLTRGRSTGAEIRAQGAEGEPFRIVDAGGQRQVPGSATKVCGLPPALLAAPRCRRRAPRARGGRGRSGATTASRAAADPP